ncbi:NADH-quinone oxidoreductase subunit L [Persicobacter diffluens]|uniref:NADH-quinone oxidoreductase subunit L n=1 Tax=Persicobacter diffluens TaxID=981 RepID=A0AAN4VXE1_9BACT|nr:NADH-quinone oxidoreductase subunit L [Persicobacter diffluens]
MEAIQTIAPIHPAIYAALLATVLPLLSFLAIAFFSKRLEETISDKIAISAISGSLLLSIYIFLQVFPNNTLEGNWHWFRVGDYSLNFGVLLDQLSVVMLLVVSLISLLVHVFSMNYMKGEKYYARYYGYLGLFTFSMLVILIADNLLLLFMGWELVGLSSYLLIGFWFERPLAANANRKAFLTNRVGDMGFLLGLMILWAYFHTLSFAELSQVFSNPGVINQIPEVWLIVAGLGIFMGTVGKSAQFPLQVWLPDAMQGPTPVSALIHAATMVAAGIFLLARVFPLLVPEVLMVVAVIGAITAIQGAYSALNQFDIKRVLAYSTSSQLGYMVLGMGVGAYEASLFHLVTHAFFKAGLFLAVGAVIHAMHHFQYQCKKLSIPVHFDPQDMRQMGDLMRRMPLIHAGYVICAAALIGLPFFSGFMSKDAILMASWEWASNMSAHGHVWAWAIPFLGFAAAVLTAFYMARQWYLVFWSKSRVLSKCQAACPCYDNLKDPSWKKTVPVGILAVMSISFVYGLNPFDGHATWLYHAFERPATVLLSGWQLSGREHLTFIPFLAVLSALGGILYAYNKYGRDEKIWEDYVHRRPQSKLGYYSLNNFYMDRFYRKHFMIRSLRWAYRLHWFDQKIMSGMVDGVAGLTVRSSKAFAWLESLNNSIINGLGVLGVILAQGTKMFDRFFVDGLVKGLGELSKGLGRGLANLQGKQVQSYITYAVVFLLFIVFWFFI